MAITLVHSSEIIPDRAATLTVAIEYLHHCKPHRTDDGARRAHKERVSSEARTRECSIEIEYSKAVERWTHLDIVAVVDQVRADMPTSGPDNDKAILCWLDPNDPYRADGRALQRVDFQRKYRGERLAMEIWFSTAAGYAARIGLDGVIPASALVPFAVAQFVFFGLSMELDVRALRRTMRARKGAVS